MSHLNARLTRQARLDLVLGVAGGWTQAEAARQFRVSRATAAKWVRRYREEGPGRPARPLLAAAPLAAPHAAARGRGRAPAAPRAGLGAAPHRLGPGRGGIDRLRRPPPRRAAPPRPDAPREPRGRALRARAPGGAAAPRRREAGAYPAGGRQALRAGLRRDRRRPEREGRRRHRLRARRDRRPLALRLRRGAAGRARPDDRGLSRAGDRPLRRPRRPGRRVLTDNGGNYPARPSGRRRRRAEWGCAGRGPTGRRPTARPKPPSRSCRPSGRTGGATTRTGSGSAPSRPSSGSTTATVRTAASAGPSPPPACKQRLWDLQLPGGQGLGALLTRGGS